MAKWYMATFLLSTVLIAGCTQFGTSPSPSPTPVPFGVYVTPTACPLKQNPPSTIPPDAHVTITLTRTMCYGPCPAYSVAIHSDGRVDYEGYNNTVVTGRRSGRISQSQFNQVLNSFLKIGFLQLNDTYSGSQYKNSSEAHGQTIITAIAVNDDTKTVSRYVDDTCVPPELHVVEDMIDAVADTQHWVGNPAK
jgi:hypothetical protein